MSSTSSDDESSEEGRWIPGLYDSIKFSIEDGQNDSVAYRFCNDPKKYLEVMEELAYGTRYPAEVGSYFFNTLQGLGNDFAYNAKFDSPYSAYAERLDCNHLLDLFDHFSHKLDSLNDNHKDLFLCGLASIPTVFKAHFNNEKCQKFSRIFFHVVSKLNNTHHYYLVRLANALMSYPQLSKALLLDNFCSKILHSRILFCPNYCKENYIGIFLQALSENVMLNEKTCRRLIIDTVNNISLRGININNLKFNAYCWFAFVQQQFDVYRIHRHPFFSFTNYVYESQMVKFPYTRICYILESVIEIFPKESQETQLEFLNRTKLYEEFSKLCSNKSNFELDALFKLPN